MKIFHFPQKEISCKHPLSKYKEKIRSSQDFILTNSCAELSFSLGVSIDNTDFNGLNLLNQIHKVCISIVIRSVIEYEIQNFELYPNSHSYFQSKIQNIEILFTTKYDNFKAMPKCLFAF